MIEWFNQKELFEQIYWIIAIPSSLIFLFIMIATFIGGDIDSDGDMDGDSDGEMGFQFFTFKNLVGFFTIFAWVGIGSIKSGYSTGSVIIISFICGLLMMVAMATLFYLMTKLVEDGTMKMSNAVGRTGSVYLPIKAKNGGFGKVQINIQGATHELQAMTNDEKNLAVGTIVQVEKVIDNTILVVTSNI
ncbi:MAG TPA: hypothetical protein EYG86_09135 [Crocinitomicaceae bacterium]|nr:hypothetical protein [Crocinitomicaceae bacterium]